MFSLLVLDVIAVSTIGIGLEVRVQAGTLRVGDRVQTARTPQGERLNVDLEARFLHLSPDAAIEELEASNAGFATLYGLYPNGVEAGWELDG